MKGQGDKNNKINRGCAKNNATGRTLPLARTFNVLPANAHKAIKAGSGRPLAGVARLLK